MAAGSRAWQRVCATVKAEHRDCHICHAPIDYTAPRYHPLSFTGDHLHPTNKGGQDTYTNCGAAHWSCNAARHDDDLGITLIHSRRW